MDNNNFEPSQSQAQPYTEQELRQYLSSQQWLQTLDLSMQTQQSALDTDMQMQSILQIDNELTINASERTSQSQIGEAMIRHQHEISQKQRALKNQESDESEEEEEEKQTLLQKRNFGKIDPMSQIAENEEDQALTAEQKQTAKHVKRMLQENHQYIIDEANAASNGVVVDRVKKIIHYAQEEDDEKQESTGKSETWDHKKGIKPEDLITYMSMPKNLYLKLDEVIQWTASEVEALHPTHRSDTIFGEAECITLATEAAVRKIPQGRMCIKQLVKDTLEKKPTAERDAMLATMLERKDFKPVEAYFAIVELLHMSAGEQVGFGVYMNAIYHASMPTQQEEILNVLHQLVIYLKKFYDAIKEHYSELRRAVIEKVDLKEAKELLKEVKTAAGFVDFEEQVRTQYAMQKYLLDIKKVKMETNYESKDQKLRAIMEAYHQWKVKMKVITKHGQNQMQVGSNESSPVQEGYESMQIDLLVIYWTCIGVAKRTDWQERIKTTEKQRRGIKREENEQPLLSDEEMINEQMPKLSDYDDIKSRIAARWQRKKCKNTNELNQDFINGWSVLESELNDPSMPDPMSGRPERVFYRGTDDKNITMDILKTGLHNQVGAVREMIQDMHYWDSQPNGEHGTPIKASMIKNLMKLQQGDEEDEFFQRTLNVVHNSLRERRLVAEFYEQLRRKRVFHKRSINEKSFGLNADEIEALAWASQHLGQQSMTSQILKLQFAVLVREMDSKIEKALQKLAEDMRQQKYNLRNLQRVNKIQASLTKLGKQLDQEEYARAYGKNGNTKDGILHVQSALNESIDWCEGKEKNKIITQIATPLGDVLDFVRMTRNLISNCFKDLKESIPERNWSKYMSIFDNLTHQAITRYFADQLKGVSYKYNICQQRTPSMQSAVQDLQEAGENRQCNSARTPMTMALRSLDICNAPEIDQKFYEDHGEEMTFTQVLLIYALQHMTPATAMQLVLACKNLFYQVHVQALYKTKETEKISKAEAEMRYIFDQLRKEYEPVLKLVCKAAVGRPRVNFLRCTQMQRKLKILPTEDESKLSKNHTLRFRDAITAETFLKPCIEIQKEPQKAHENYAKYFTALSLITHINAIKGEGDTLDLSVQDYEDAYKLWKQLQVQWNTSECIQGQHQWFTNTEKLYEGIKELKMQTMVYREKITQDNERKLLKEIEKQLLKLKGQDQKKEARIKALGDNKFEVLLSISKEYHLPSEMTMLNATGFYRVIPNNFVLAKYQQNLNRPEEAYYAPIPDCVEVNIKVHQELQPPINWNPDVTDKMKVMLKEKLNKDTQPKPNDKIVNVKRTLEVHVHRTALIYPHAYEYEKLDSAMEVLQTAHRDFLENKKPKKREDIPQVREAALNRASISAPAAHERQDDNIKKLALNSRCYNLISTPIYAPWYQTQGRFTIWKQWIREVQIVNKVMAAKNTPKNSMPFKAREIRHIIEEVKEQPKIVFPVDDQIQTIKAKQHREQAMAGDDLNIDYASAGLLKGMLPSSHHELMKATRIHVAAWVRGQVPTYKEIYGVYLAAYELLRRSQAHVWKLHLRGMRKELINKEILYFNFEQDFMDVLKSQGNFENLLHQGNRSAIETLEGKNCTKLFGRMAAGTRSNAKTGAHFEIYHQKNLTNARCPAMKRRVGKQSKEDHSHMNVLMFTFQATRGTRKITKEEIEKEEEVLSRWSNQFNGSLVAKEKRKIYKAPNIQQAEYSHCLAMLRFGGEGCNYNYKGDALVEKLRQTYLRDFDADIDTDSKRWKGGMALQLLKGWETICYIQPMIMIREESKQKNNLEELLIKIHNSKK